MQYNSTGRCESPQQTLSYDTPMDNRKNQRGFSIIELSDMVEDKINHLYECIQILQNGLNPILSSEPPSPAPTPQEDPFLNSTLACKEYNHLRQIEGAIENLQSLIGRINL